jgi:hypothetical protein
LNLRIILRSVVARLAASLAVGATRWLAPQGGIAGAVCHALALPGALMLSVRFPEGPHSGRGVPHWGAMVLALNLVLYSAAWFIVFLIRATIVRRRRST